MPKIARRGNNELPQAWWEDAPRVRGVAGLESMCMRNSRLLPLSRALFLLPMLPAAFIVTLDAAARLPSGIAPASLRCSALSTNCPVNKNIRCQRSRSFLTRLCCFSRAGASLKKGGGGNRKPRPSPKIAPGDDGKCLLGEGVEAVTASSPDTPEASSSDHSPLPDSRHPVSRLCRDRHTG